MSQNFFLHDLLEKQSKNHSINKTVLLGINLTGDPVRNSVSTPLSDRYALKVDQSIVKQVFMCVCFCREINGLIHLDASI